MRHWRRGAGSLLAIGAVLAILLGLRPADGAAAPAPAGGYRLAAWPHDAARPDFSLIDTDGHPRTLAEFHGQVIVLMFGFTHCPDVCPAELYKLALTMKKLKPRDVPVRVLFISLDPERDTPSALKSYVAAFDPHFIGLTGTAAQVDAAANSFFVQYARVAEGNDYVISHSTGIYLIDADGQLRLVGTMNTTVNDLAHDIAALARSRDQ